MAYRNRLPEAAAGWGLWLAAAAWLVAGRMAFAAAASAPAPAEPATQPLPARASVGLEDLPPRVEKPVNPPGADKLPPRAAEDVAEAERQIGQKNYSAAIELLERAAGFDPRNARIQRLLGQAYLLLPNRGKALVSLTAAVQAAPDDLETHLLLGQLAAAGRQTDQAMLHLRTALKCSEARPADPRAGEALLTLSLLLDREGYWTAALEGYTRLSEWTDQHGPEYAGRAGLRDWVMHPDRLLSRRGGLLALLRRYEQAAEVLDQAYRRDRTNGRTATLLVEALLAAKRYGQAEKLLLELAGQPAQGPHVPRMAAELCRSTRDRSLPQRLWQAARDNRKADPAFGIALAKAAQELSWGEEAVAILKSILAEQPGDADLWRILCRQYAQRDQYQPLFELMAGSLQGRPEILEAVAGGIDQLAAAARQAGVERTFADLARKNESPARPQLLYLAGRLATDLGKHILAADLYDRAIEAKAGFLPAYEALLDSYVAQNRLDRADRLLERAEKADPNGHFPPYLRGKAALRRGNAQAAVEALRRAQQAKADDLPTALLLADAHVAAGQPEEAQRVLRAAMDAHARDDSPPRKLFDLLMSSRQFAQARDVAAAVLRRNRDSLAGRMMIAELALQTGRRNDALVLLGQLAREAPDNQDVQILAVRAAVGPTPGLVRKKEFDEGVEKLTRILRVAPGSRPARLALADLLAGVDKRDEAANLWAALLEETPGDQDLAARYVRALTDANQFATALRAVERFRKDSPDNLWGRARYAELLGKVGRFDELTASVRQWMKDAPDDNVRRLWSGELLRILDVQKRYAEALKLIDEWIAQGAKGPDSEVRRLGFARIRLLALSKEYDKALAEAGRLGEPDQAGEARRLVALVAAQAKDNEAALRLAGRQKAACRQLLADLDACRKLVADLEARKAKAGDDLDAAVGKLPESLRPSIKDPVADGRHAVALAEIDRWREALQQQLDGVWLLEIVAAGQAKQLERARSAAEEWIKADPNALPPRRALVGVMVGADAIEEADRLVGRWAAGLTPATASTQPAAMGETLRWVLEMSIRTKMLRGMHIEAMALADRAIRADPKNSELLALMSACLTELRRDAEAMAAMEAAYALQSESPSLGNNLGYLYAERGIKLDQAERMLRKSLSLLPEETAFQDSLGWIFYRQGRLVEAGRVFQALLARRDSQEPEHAVIVDHAGDTYWRLGWNDRAVEFWKRAVELAGKAKRPAREEQELLARTPGKIEAAKAGREPALAPVVGPATAPAPPAEPAEPAEPKADN